VKITPTLKGELRIDTDAPGDWALLNGIANDALSCEASLAQRLGNLITDEEVTADWQDFVIPDLDKQFSSALLHVTTAIATAHLESDGGPGLLWINREDGLQWYSALNQARLAIEQQYRFGPSETINPDEFPPKRRTAFLRSQFYLAIQSLLLDHVMR
jgi:hypothetical protein